MPKKCRESLPDDLWKLPRQVTCFRCNKPEQEHPSFRLLPGSNHITLCPECYVVVWSGHTLSEANQ
jgi:hypothetical protein